MTLPPHNKLKPGYSEPPIKLFCGYCKKLIYKTQGWIDCGTKFISVNRLYVPLDNLMDALQNGVIPRNIVKHFHIKCWEETAGDLYVPKFNYDTYICKICDHPIMAGDNHVEINYYLDSNNKYSMSICDDCFIAVAGEEFWKIIF